jgi:hypothetical protein
MKCKSPRNVGSDIKHPNIVNEMISTHDWVFVYGEPNPWGILCRYRCSKCDSEWVTIVTSPA